MITREVLQAFALFQLASIIVLSILAFKVQDLTAPHLALACFAFLVGWISASVREDIRMKYRR